MRANVAPTTRRPRVCQAGYAHPWSQRRKLARGFDPRNKALDNLQRIFQEPGKNDFADQDRINFIVNAAPQVYANT